VLGAFEDTVDVWPVRGQATIHRVMTAQNRCTTNTAPLALAKSGVRQRHSRSIGIVGGIGHACVGLRGSDDGVQMEDDVMTMKRAIVTGLSAAGLVLAGGLSWAAGQYGPGASDTEIKIGNTVPYSGPASAYGTIGKSEAAYFAMINDQGGINGRKVNFLSRDDSYSPPKTLEVVRKLVEEDQVLLMFGTLGTPPNTAIQGYLNDNKVPQLFVTTGANKWNDPKHHPWDHGLDTHLSDRGAHIRPLHPENSARRQDRTALSER
jgi:ABC-type branched-subunit amino acid transport system substrate-binding protein